MRRRVFDVFGQSKKNLRMKFIFPFLIFILLQYRDNHINKAWNLMLCSFWLISSELQELVWSIWKSLVFQLGWELGSHWSLCVHFLAFKNKQKYPITKFWIISLKFSFDEWYPPADYVKACRFTSISAACFNMPSDKNLFEKTLSQFNYTVWQMKMIGHGLNASTLPRPNIH